MEAQFGDIEDDFVLEDDLRLHGKAKGNMTVVKGGNLLLYGICCKQLIVETGGEVHVHGIVMGKAINRGGELSVHGGAKLLRGMTTESGNTNVDESATIADSIKEGAHQKSINVGGSGSRKWWQFWR